MRPFNLEYRAIAGWHDGVRARVADFSLDSPIVTAHEAMHERIFRETPDGQILAAYCQAIEHEVVEDGVREVAESSLQVFMENARLPHEVFATYLSVKSLPASLEVDLLNQLTPEYLAYYRPLANILEPLFTSSYLQFIVAWNCAVAVFSSPLLERFPSLNKHQVVTLLPEEDLTSRYHLLISALSEIDLSVIANSCESTARLVCDRNGFTYWDVFSDDAWTEHTYSNGIVNKDGIFVEQGISEMMRQSLASCLPFEFLHGERLSKAFEKFEGAMLSNLNMRYTEWSKLDIIGANIPQEAVGRAIMASSARVFNTGSIQLARKEGAILLLDSTFEETSRFAIYSASPPVDHLKFWNVILWDSSEDEQISLMGRFEIRDVFAFLEKWIDREQQTMSVPAVTAIVLAVQSVAEMMQVQVDSEHLLWRSERFFEKLCWYCWDGFYDIYRMFCKPESRLFSGRMETEGFEPFTESTPIERISTYNGLVIKVLCLGEINETGLYVRFYPTQTANPLLSMESELEEREMLLPMSHDMMERFQPLMSEVLTCAQTFWDEY